METPLGKVFQEGMGVLRRGQGPIVRKLKSKHLKKNFDRESEKCIFCCLFVMSDMLRNENLLQKHIMHKFKICNFLVT